MTVSSAIPMGTRWSSARVVCCKRGNWCSVAAQPARQLASLRLPQCNCALAAAGKEAVGHAERKVPHRLAVECDLLHHSISANRIRTLKATRLALLQLNT